jgi:hypothetical protein
VAGRTRKQGIKRLPTDRLRASHGMSGRLSPIRSMTHSSHRVSRCVRESPGEAVNEAVKSSREFRQIVGRGFRFKHWRGLATIYDKHATVYRGALVLSAALLWINDLSGIVASVLGVQHVFGELRPALVRRCDELDENGGALDAVRAGLAEEGEELLVPRLHP